MQSAREDLLTRTTLRLTSGPAPLAIESVIRALQRVPGVLTVEADPRGESALVAHDAAVPLTSLVYAARSAGASAEEVGESRRPSVPIATTPLPKALSGSHLRVFSLAAILAVIAIDITFPTSPEKRWLLLGPLAVLWVFFVVRDLISRRR